MDKQKRNWIIFFVIVALVAGYLGVRAILNSDAYLEWKAERIMDDIREFMAEDVARWQELAEVIRDEAQSRDDKSLYRSEHQSEFPEALDAQVGSMIAGCTVNFDTVFVDGVTKGGYPEGFCIFRYTIEFDRGVHEFDQGVYAWIDLIYAPGYDGQTYRPFARESAHIIGDWYVIKCYGY